MIWRTSAIRDIPLLGLDRRVSAPEPPWPPRADARARARRPPGRRPDRAGVHVDDVPRVRPAAARPLLRLPQRGPAARAGQARARALQGGLRVQQLGVPRALHGAQRHRRRDVRDAAPGGRGPRRAEGAALVAPRPAIACSLYVSPAAICGDRVESPSRSLKALTRGRAGGAQLATGWGVWRQLGGKKHDYNLAFATGGIQALQAALGPKEAVDLKCVFRADLGDDWVRYLRTYGAGQRPRGPPSLSAASQKHCSYGPPPAGPDGGAGRGRSACGPSRAECARACRLQRAARPAGWRRCMRAALRRHPGSCFVKRLRLRWRPAAPDSRSASPRAQP